MTSTPALRLENVSMRFGGVKALDSVSFEIEVGEARGIIGPNGSGKSTLLNVISGVYRPTNGTVRLGDVDVTSLHPWAPRRDGVARTFQSPQSAPLLTLREASMVGLDARKLLHRGRAQPRGWAAARATEMLETFGCGAYADALVSEVPYGTLRLAEIGGAVLREPQVLLLDEPAAGLNGEERIELVDRLLEVQTQYPTMSVILIEHDLSFVSALCTRLVALDFGRVVDDGPLEDVLKGDAVLNSFLGGRENA